MAPGILGRWPESTDERLKYGFHGTVNAKNL